MRAIVILLFILFYNSNAWAQNSNDNSIQELFEYYTSKEENNNLKPKGFYKKYLSAQISANCEFSTTCSVFMRQATRKIGLTRGFLLGIDRLSRCGSSDHTYQFLPALILNFNMSLIDDIHFYHD